MTFGESKELVKVIQGAYPHRLLSRETAAVWFEFLKECDCHQVKRRIEAHIKVSQYIPTIFGMYVQPVEETTILQTIRNWEKEGAKRIEKERRNPRPRPAPPWER